MEGELLRLDLVHDLLALVVASQLRVAVAEEVVGRRCGAAHIAQQLVRALGDNSWGERALRNLQLCESWGGGRELKLR